MAKFVYGPYEVANSVFLTINHFSKETPHQFFMVIGKFKPFMSDFRNSLCDNDVEFSVAQRLFGRDRSDNNSIGDIALQSLEDEIMLMRLFDLPDPNTLLFNDSQYLNYSPQGSSRSHRDSTSTLVDALNMENNGNPLSPVRREDIPANSSTDHLSSPKGLGLSLIQRMQKRTAANASVTAPPQTPTSPLLPRLHLENLEQILRTIKRRNAERGADKDRPEKEFFIRSKNDSSDGKGSTSSS